MAKGGLAAAYAHFPIGIGILASVVIWFLYKEKDKYTSFQAKQAVVWQLLLGVIGTGIGVVFGLVSGALPFLGAGINGQTLIYISVAIGVIGFATITLFFVVVAGFALWGAYKSFKGQDFYYPLIGKLLR